MRSDIVLAGACVFTLAAGAAHADTVRATYSFGIFTNNGGGVNAPAGDVIRMDVIQTGIAAQAAFEFYFASSYDMSITHIYWDDLVSGSGVLASVNSITDSGAGVDFATSGSGNVPSGNTIDFTADFRVGATPPPSQNGVDSDSEWLRVLFNLESGMDVDDVLAALTTGLTNPYDNVTGGLRVAMHVQSFADNNSESFVNSTIVPLPTASWAGITALAGLGGIGYLRRRSFKA